MKQLLSTLIVLAGSAPAIADSQFSLTTGIDYSTGKYGNAVSTRILYVPVTGQYGSGKLTLKLTVPYISVSGPGGVIHGYGRVGAGMRGGAPGMGAPGAGGGTTTTTNSGLGDVVAAAGYNVYFAEPLSVDVVGKVKFGTADANKGLGTGANDYSAQVDGYYTFREKTTLFATAGYKVVGAPSGIAVNDVPFGALGASQKVGDAASVGVMLSAMQSATAAAGKQQEVAVYASRKLGNAKVQGSVLKGYADGSPDYGAAVMITGYF